MPWTTVTVLRSPKKLEDSCAAAMRKQNLARLDLDQHLPRALIERHFQACCFGQDLDTAFRLHHYECVLKIELELERAYFSVGSDSPEPEFLTLLRKSRRLLECWSTSGAPADSTL